MSRPVGITVIGILQVLLGTLLLLIGAALLAFQDQIAGELARPAIPLDRTLIDVLGGTLIFAGLLAWLFAYGLFRLKPWAWWASLVLQVLSVLSTISAGQQGPLQLLIGLLIPGAIIFYLFRPPVRAAFVKA